MAPSEFHGKDHKVAGVASGVSARPDAAQHMCDLQLLFCQAFTNVKPLTAQPLMIGISARQALKACTTGGMLA